MDAQVSRGRLFEHVLWIGGPPGSGKTSIATRLARRHGLRWYGSDTQTWAHRDRALAAHVPAAERWESLPPAARGEAPPDELLAMSLHRERGQMVVDDVGSLPETPLLVAEGSEVPAWVISGGLSDETRAIWLMPTPSFQRTRIAGLPPGARTLYALLRDVVEGETREHGAPVLTIDGTLRIDEVTDAGEELFAGAISEGPRAETVSERQALLRGANEARVEQVRAYHRRPWAEGEPESVVRPFLCECGRADCSESVEVTVGRATEPVYAAGHG
jgi:hypothetical protein